MHSIYTQFLQALPVSIFIFITSWICTLFSTLSYVKEKIEIYAYVTSMIKILSMYLHPRALGPYLNPNPQ